MYKVTLKEQHLRVIREAADLYSRTLRGDMSGFPSVLKSIKKRISFGIEASLLHDLKTAIFSELKSAQVYSINDTRVSALTKMVYDVERSISHRIAWDTSGGFGAYEPPETLSGEVAPNFSKLFDGVHEAHYIIVISERLLFSLTKALQLYEGIVCGNFSVLPEILETSSRRIAAPSLLHKTLNNMKLEYFPELGIDDSYDANKKTTFLGARVAVGFRAFIEKQYLKVAA